MRALGIVAGAMVGLAIPASAGADEQPFTLDWNAPAGCPSQAAVEDAVRDLLGGARVASENRVEAHAIVTRRDGIWRVELETRRGEARGSRRVEAGSCKEVGEAVALTIALTIDPEKAGAASPIAGAPPPPPPPVAPPPVAPPPVAAASRPPPVAPADPRARGNTLGNDRRPTRPLSDDSSRTRVPLGAGFVGDAGVLPTPQFGGALSLGVLRGRLRGDLTATYLPPSLGSFESSGSGAGRMNLLASTGARFWMLSGNIRACYIFTTSIELATCAAFEAGMIHGTLESLNSSASETAPWAAVGLGGALGVRLFAGFALWMPALVELGVDRPKFTITGTASTVHQPAVVTGRLEIGVEVRF